MSRIRRNPARKLDHTVRRPPARAASARLSPTRVIFACDRRRGRGKRPEPAGAVPL